MKIKHSRVSTDRSVTQKSVCETMMAQKQRKRQTSMPHCICLDDAWATTANSGVPLPCKFESSPVWSHCLFPSPGHSGWICFDSGAFSVHHQQTCTARVQLELEKRHVWIWEITLARTHGLHSFTPLKPLGAHLLVMLGTRASNLTAVVL